jgi:Bacterial regulatory proteins, luxR family
MALKLLDEFKQLSRSDRGPVSTQRVTARELEVLKLVAEGLNNRDIGKGRFISKNTAFVRRRVQGVVPGELADTAGLADGTQGRPHRWLIRRDARVPRLIRNGRDCQSARQSCSAGRVGRRGGGPMPG